MATNFIEFDGGETLLPDKIRKLKTVGNDNLTPTTKFIYLAIRWCKTVLHKKDNRFDPSYSFMKKRFGVSSDSYKRALEELSELGAIRVIKDSCGDKKYLKIDLLIESDDIAERIPSVIITTEVLTIPQKLFLALVWKLFYVDGEKDSISTYYSTYKIANDLNLIGISKKSTYTRIKELSGDGYVPLLITRNDGGFIIDINVILSLWEYEDTLWSRFKMLGGKKNDYPVYKKPKYGDFKYINEKIIKNEK